MIKISYVGVLLSSLRDNGVGCWFGKLFVGAIAYADDIVLLAMRVMLPECDRFGCQYSVKFNATKSKIMLFAAKGKTSRTLSVGRVSV